jgi:hypothetical protein
MSELGEAGLEMDGADGLCSEGGVLGFKEFELFFKFL